MPGVAPSSTAKRAGEASESPAKKAKVKAEKAAKAPSDEEEAPALMQVDPKSSEVPNVTEEEKKFCELVRVKHAPDSTYRPRTVAEVSLACGAPFSHSYIQRR